MTLEQIEKIIQDCYVAEITGGIDKEHLKEALHKLVPCLGYIGEIEDDCYREWGEAVVDAVESCDLSGERWKLKYVEGITAPQYSKYLRAKNLNSNLGKAISAIQTEMKDIMI